METAPTLVPLENAPSSSPPDADLLFKEAKQRERRRRLAWLGAAVIVSACVAGTIVGLTGGRPTPPRQRSPRPPHASVFPPSATTPSSTSPPGTSQSVLWQQAATVLSVKPDEIVVQDFRIHPNPAWDTFKRTIQVTTKTEYFVGSGSEVGSDALIQPGTTILYDVLLPHGEVPSDVTPQVPLTSVSVTQGS